MYIVKSFLLGLHQDFQFLQILLLFIMKYINICPRIAHFTANNFIKTYKKSA